MKNILRLIDITERAYERSVRKEVRHLKIEIFFTARQGKWNISKDYLDEELPFVKEVCRRLSEKGFEVHLLELSTGYLRVKVSWRLK